VDVEVIAVEANEVHFAAVRPDERRQDFPANLRDLLLGALVHEAYIGAK
jgi:hypothetical protein